MKTTIVLIMLVTGSINAFAGYKSGWTYINFYEAVGSCRQSIVFPQVKSYEKKGQANNKDKDTLNEEMIQITPVLDRMATDVCFCTYNEIAKDKTFEEYKQGVDIEGYMETPRCKKTMEERAKSMKKDIETLRLQ